MSIEKVVVTFYAAQPIADLRPVIDEFHRWIQDKRVPGMLIDVADYAHVPNGPGILLIGHEADHAIDEAEGPQGYLYSRKRGLQGTDAERLEQVLREAAHAASVFAQSGLGLAFDARRVRLVFNDRLHQPNDDVTWNAVQPAVEQAVAAVFGSDGAVIERDTSDPRRRLTAHVAVDAEVALNDLAGAAGTA